MRNILIVEDSLKMRWILKKTIHKHFPLLVVHESDSSQSALHLLLKEEIDLMIFDIGLPDKDGVTLASEIRRIDRYYLTPIIFITADFTKELSAYRMTHCLHYMIKPFNPEILINLINQVMSHPDNKKTEQDKKLLLEFKSHNQWVYEKDILYIEYVNRKIRIHFSDNSLDYKSQPLTTFKQNLSEVFIQIHQSFLINITQIEYINSKDHSVKVFDKNDILPIGRNYYKDVSKLIKKPSDNSL